MSHALVAYGVKIVSLGNNRAQIALARQVISEWNEQHAWRGQSIMIPVPEEFSEADSGADLLVAFIEADGIDMKTLDQSEVGREIVAYQEKERPVLVYVSHHCTDFNAMTVCANKIEAWTVLLGEGVSVYSFGDEQEFRAKFSHRLEELVGVDPGLRRGTGIPHYSLKEPISPEDLSRRARTLLLEASEDPETYIGVVKDSFSLKIQVNGRQLVAEVDQREMAEWEKAFQELLDLSLIKKSGCQGRLFQISDLGFEFLRSIGRAPVGYIPEQGGF